MNHKQWPVLLVVLVVALGLALAAAAPAPEVAQAAPEQALACTWQNIGTSSKDLFHFGTAYDTDLNKMHVYGGVDPDLTAQNSVQAGDLSGATLRVTWSNVAAGGARDMVGPARRLSQQGRQLGGLLGRGMPDPDDGRRGLVRAAALRHQDQHLGTTHDGDRTSMRVLFASAAYDPVHDVVWVVGGVTSCKLADVLAGNACNCRQPGDAVPAASMPRPASPSGTPSPAQISRSTAPRWCTTPRGRAWSCSAAHRTYRAARTTSRCSTCPTPT